MYMWRNLGIDAGLFSRRLMGVASDHFARDAPDPSAPPPDPSALLEAAYEGALAERIKGSATACVEKCGLTTAHCAGCRNSSSDSC